MTRTFGFFLAAKTYQLMKFCLGGTWSANFTAGVYMITSTHKDIEVSITASDGKDSDK
jgi:hypothetical protein